MTSRASAASPGSVVLPCDDPARPGHICKGWSGSAALCLIGVYRINNSLANNKGLDEIKSFNNKVVKQPNDEISGATLPKNKASILTLLLAARLPRSPCCVTDLLA